MIPPGALKVRRAALAGRNEFADDGERQVGEGGVPFRLQGAERARIHREEEFVVFAIAPGLVEGAAGITGQGGHIDLKVRATGQREARQVLREAVADVHHGMRVRIFREPAAFFESRDEFEVFPFDGATETAGDE